MTDHIKRPGQTGKKQKKACDVETGNGILYDYRWCMCTKQRRQQIK